MTEQPVIEDRRFIICFQYTREGYVQEGKAKVVMNLQSTVHFGEEQQFWRMFEMFNEAFEKQIEGGREQYENRSQEREQ